MKTVQEIEVMMNSKKNLATIRKILKRLYPEVRTQLRYKSVFQLLVATILSAQCTDVQVNSVTRELFQELPGPGDFARADARRLEKLIYSTGFYRNKAKNIKGCARMLMERHSGKVPETMEELLELPGVGRKTANLVLSVGYGIPGMVVDTHVLRISGRLGFTDNKDPAKVEADLAKVVPVNEWDAFSLRLIFFGRETCRAQRPKCGECRLAELCLFNGRGLPMLIS